MKKLLLITLGLVWFNVLFAVQLSGTYTIDATQPATATNFRNFNSALVFMNSDLPRPDGGPSNVAPFGVSGPVTFNVVASSGPYHEQIRIRYVVGSSAINTITFEGNNNIITDTCNATVRGLVVLDSADHIRIRNFIIRPMLDAVNTGWGVHFTNRADSNLIENCTIDIGLITSTSSVNSAGIVMSGSLNSPTTTVECLRNTIQNNTIRGGATNSGMYYGIILSLASGLNITNNRIINNTIEDFFYAGIQLSSTNRTIVRGNTIRRPLKTSSTTTFGIFGQNSTRFDSISYNRITDLFSGMPTNTNQVTAIYLINYSATATEPTTILNNFIRINNGDGNQFGINLLSSSNLRIYNNTIVLDNASSTSATAQTSGISSNVTTSAASILDLRNNIISITRGGTGPKWAINTSGNWAIGSTIGKNGYFSNAQNYNMASYLGINYPTYNAYRTFLATVDQTSVDFNPLFVNSSTGNFSPQDAWYDGNGDAIPGLTVDINGTTRTLPLDVGAFEATPQLLDVAMNDIVLPVAPYVAGAQNISVRLRNGGTTAITSAIINWTVNGVPQTPVNFTGSLAGGSISAPILLGSITTVSGTLFNITATVSQPNGGTDPIASNNSASGTTASTLPGGTYTLNNGLPASATNFTSLQTFAELISIGGISGPVVLNAAQGSGPYVGQVAFRRVLGASITNTVTFNGNGVVVQANPTTSETYVILLNGTDYARLNNFTVRTLNPSNSIGLLFTGRADSNIVDNVTIDFSNVNTNSLNAGIAFTASLSNPSATSGAHNGIFNLIQNNRIIGNPSGGLFISISHMGGSSEYTTIPSNNRFINNELVDVYATGFVSQFSSRNIIRNNLIYQSGFRTAFTTFTGINVSNGWLGDTIDNNRIYNAFINNLTTTLTCTGISLNSAYSQTTAPGVVRNNLIYGFAGIGTTNGISLSFTTSVLVQHNTVFFNNPSASATSIITGINISTFNTTHNLSVRNNIVSVVRGGTGFKIGVLVGASVTTSPTTFVVNNNAYFVGGGTNAIVGRFTTLDFPTLALWRTANASAYDQNAVYANPNFRNQFNPNLLLPNNDTLNNVGANLLTTVPTDVTGVNRTATPDPGAYEFTPSGNDAGLTRFTSPLSPISLGSNNVEVMLRNFGNNALTSTAIDWTVDGISQGTTNWAGSLNSGDSVSTSIGSFNFVNTGFYEFKAWTSSPNNTTDDFRINDTITTTYCTPVSGTITINPSVAASATNYHTFNALVNVLRTCGIIGNVIVNVAAGTYNEQVNITGISGLNNGNRIIFNGADSATTRLVFSSSNNAARYTLQLYGADNITFNNIRFEANGLSLGTAVQILADGTNRSDSVTFKRC
nr:right-handed parallel beta-helix repeat-containing protein [Bacteroidia bacterium]